MEKGEIEPLAPPTSISTSERQFGKDYLPGLASTNGITSAEAARSRPCGDIENPLLFVISASSEQSLLETLAKLRRWALSRIDLPAYEHALAYTLSNRRSMMQWRYSTVAAHRSELMDALSQDSPQPIRVAEELQVAFIFTGQGAQWYAMGRELMSFESPFSASIQKSDMILQDFGTSWSLQTELLRNRATSRMDESQIAQPASTALQIALVDLLASINISPRMVLGHSSGEIGAAYAAGIVSHEQALRLSYCRSQVASICKTSSSSRGAMLAVGLGEREVLPFLTTTSNGLVEVACVNSPSSTTLSGDEAAILEIEKVLSGRHTFCRRLNVDIAYHSQHMRQVANRYRCLLGNMKVQVPRDDIKFVSSVTAQQKVGNFDTEYWIENLVSKVRFRDALEEYCRNQTSQSTLVFVEIGPHSSLSGPIRQTLAHAFDDLKYRYLPTLERNRNALRSILVLGGKLWEMGYQVNIAAANSLTGINGERRVLQDLPSYSWDHSRTYWHESRLSREHNQRQHPYHELLGVRIPGINSIAPSWRYIIDLDTLPWLADHVVDGQITFPGAGYICMVVEAIHQLIREKQPPQKFSKFMLQDVNFLRALTVLPAPAKVELQICFQAGQFADTNCHTFRVVAFSPDKVWHEHCRGQITLELDHSANSGESEVAGNTSNTVSFGRSSQEEIPVNCSHDLSSAEIYQGLRVGGNLYGPCFAAIQALRLCEKEAVGRIRIPNIAAVMPYDYQQPYVIHPTTLDAIMHSVLPSYAQTSGQGAIMPVSIRHMAISLKLPRDPGQELVATTILGAHDLRSARTGITVIGTGGLPKSEALLTISDMRICKVGNAERTSASGLSPSRHVTYRMIWESDVELNSLSVAKPAVVMSRACFMRQLRFKYPPLSVLHLGVGSAKDIASDLGVLADGTLPMPMCYHVVSETAESSERLRSLFKPGNSWLSFRSLDATQDLTQLHRDGETYDVIICAGLQKSLPWSEFMMTTIRKLLRPDGRLVANFEVLTASKRDELQQLLLKHKLGDLAWFREADLEGASTEDANTGITLVSKSVDVHPQVFPHPVQIIAEDGPKAFASTLRVSIDCEGIEAHLSTWSSLDGVRQAAYIIIDNGESPMLVRPSADRFKRIATIMGSSSAVLWISVQSSVEAARNPEKGLIDGFARSACAENEKLRFVHLDVQEAIEHCMPDLAQMVTQLMSVALRSSEGGKPVDDQQYIYRSGQLLIPRLVPIEVASDWRGNPEKDSGLARHGKALEYEIGSTDIEIAVRARSLSTTDNSAGLASPSPNACTEVRGFAGYISAVGSNATNDFRKGQLVCAWTTRDDQYVDISRVDCTQVVSLPESIPMAVAATIPSNFASVYHVLIDIARLRQDQSILIHEADSDFGQIACSIARHIGAVVLATVSSGTGMLMLLEKLKLPKENIFLVRSRNFQRNLLEKRVDKGADVVFNSASTDPGPGIWDCICPLGIFVQVRHLSSQETCSHVSSPSNKTLTIIAFDPAVLLVRNLERLPVLIDNVVSMLKNQDPATYPSAKCLVFACTKELSKAKYTKSQNRGAVYDVHEHSRAKVLGIADRVLHSTEYHLDHTATYVIAGGLGDLGQQICRLLARRGAKNILIFSRRPLSQERKRSFQDKFRQLSRGVEIHTTICDISDRSVVEEAVMRLRQDGLPPVKGIIQAAAVLQVSPSDLSNTMSTILSHPMWLQDSVLERMTLEDLLVPLKAKMDGTRNLNEAFRDPPLDFLIMLSSLSGVVGTRGQANYAAGNTYQDAFAMNRDVSETNFLSINLGMIESSTAYGGSQGRARSRNLLRQGWSPVTDAELLNLLDYAMSPEAHKEGLGQVAIGVNGASIAEAAHPTPTMKSALFVHVRGSSGKQDKGSSEDNGVSLKDSIAGADSLDDASHIIAEATGKQLACLIGMEPGAISLVKPVLDYGVDSLTAIELKNWISHEFGTTVHASEILDEPSLKTLGKKVASRSQLISKNSSCNPGSQLTDHTTSNGHSSTQTPVVYSGATVGNAGTALPKLPLPDLPDTLEFYLDSARPFLIDENFTHTSNVINELQASQCRNLQERLELRLLDPHVDNWHFDLQVNGIYLRRRAPIHPYGTFYGSHLPNIEPHSQAGRAAIIAASAWQFKKKLDAGNVEDQYVNEELLCMDSLRWLFNTNRQPNKTLDKICQYPSNDYLIALRKGHVFKVILTSNGCPATHTTLKAVFETILERSNTSFPAVATLTASERDSWAVLRAKVRSASTENRALIDMIEAAAFVVCLDDESPQTPSQRCNQFLLGNPANRWSDKSLQFVVCQNGVSGYVCEHTMIDALSVRPLNAFIADAIRGKEPSSGVAKPSNDSEELVEQYRFATDNCIDEEIVRVKEHFNATYSPAEFIRFELPILNNGLLRVHKIQSKFGCQLAIQLASYLHYGQQYPSWETITTMTFHKGRLDWMQVVSQSMAAFCKLAASSNTATTDCLRLLRKAAKAHTSTMTRITRGRGFAAHLEALREAILEANEELPDLFTDPTWEVMQVTSTRKIKTDASEGLMVQEAGFYMPDPESVWVHYEIGSEGCLFFVQGAVGLTESYCEALMAAAERIKNILESKH